MTQPATRRSDLLTRIVSLTTAIRPDEEPDRENFDTVPIVEIPPGLLIDLPHFRVQPDAHTTAAIASGSLGTPPGRMLGIVRGEGETSFTLWFTRPRQSVALTLYAPPGTAEEATIATLYGPHLVPLQALQVFHGRSGQKVRLRMSLPSGGAFDSLTLQMPVGTYIDDVEMLSPSDSSAEEIDFDELAVGPIPSLIVQPKYFIIAAQGAIRIGRAADDGTSGHVLTSDSPANNDVSVIFGTRRDTLDLTAVPDPTSTEASSIEFLSGGDFEVLHGVSVDPAGGAQHLSYTEHDPGKSIQGVRWTGGRLTLDHLTLHSHN